MTKSDPKFFDPLDELLDRPIAFNPAFRRITGSTVAALMLSQSWYWTKRHPETEGWFFQTQIEWQEQTGLSRSEQETARRILVRLGLQEEERKGMPAQLFFRANKPAIYAALGITQYAGIQQSRVPEAPNHESDIPAVINKNTETAAESKEAHEAHSPIPDQDLPIDWQIAHGKKPAQPSRPALITQAIREHFKLTPNWETKTNRQWLRWAMDAQITPMQIAHAAEAFKSDRRFNWQPANLKAIQEHWLELIEDYTDKHWPHEQAPAPRSAPNALAGTTTMPSTIKARTK